MPVIKILLGALTGTSLMTAFSYMVANKFNRQFKEPVLLNRLFLRADIPDTPVKAVPVFGWVLHYTIGAVFVVIFHFIWELTAVEPSLLSGAVLGFLCGFPGVAGWKIFFRFHPNPPIIDFTNYYLQLIAAHVIFGIGAAGGYLLL